MLSEFTLVGFHAEIEDSITEVVDARDWIEAAKLYGDTLKEYQLAGVLKGRVSMVGTWESLPADPNWQPDKLGPLRRYTVYGFELKGECARADVVDARHWTFAEQRVEERVLAELHIFCNRIVRLGLNAPRVGQAPSTAAEWCVWLEAASKVYREREGVELAKGPAGYDLVARLRHEPGDRALDIDAVEKLIHRDLGANYKFIAAAEGNVPFAGTNQELVAAEKGTAAHDPSETFIDYEEGAAVSAE